MYLLWLSLLALKKICLHNQQFLTRESCYTKLISATSVGIKYLLHIFRRANVFIFITPCLSPKICLQ